MKKILLMGLTICFMSACASIPTQPCKEKRVRPYFFERGEELAAFRVNVKARQQAIDGILQIKKTAAETYEVTLYSVVGAYRILQATLTRARIDYNFIIPAANNVTVRVKTERFLNLLLFPAQSTGKCKAKSDNVRVSYKHAPMRYEYDLEESYPEELIGPKSFGRVHLKFDDYQPYEEGQLPHKLHYKDGKIEADLTLLRLKQ